ncbi:MAG: hypothetical protein IRZ08_09595 [Frankia sp.]|nr:hypothetical protein [Frankia sp.]
MAADLSASVFSFAAQKTAIDLRADYVVENYNIVFGVALLVVTGLFLCSCIVGAVRGDPHVFARAIGSTGTAILGSFVALTLLQMMLAASDGIAEAFGDGQPLGASLVAELRALPEQGNFALDMVLSLLVAIFSFALFVVLYIRKVAIIVVAVFIPIYLAGQPAMSTSTWMKRATELLLALIFAKPVIYAIFTLGAGMAGDSSGSAVDQTLTILSGIVVMIAAVFAPFMLMQLFGFADVHLMRAVGSMGRRGAASFGQGAGALLGQTSRETFRGIGARLQARNRAGLIGDAAGAAPAAIGAGPSVGRPMIRAARPGLPARPGAPRPARAGTVASGSGLTAAAARKALPSASPVRSSAARVAAPRGRTTMSPPASSNGAASAGVGPAVRPPVVPPPRPRVTGGPGRSGG